MTDRIAFAGAVTADGRRLRGEVVLAGSRTWRNGEWLEVDPAAVVKADATSAFASWEHDDEKVLADIPTGSLRVNRTETGFTYETDDLPNTTYANDALELVRLGLVKGTSFEIEDLRSTFHTDPETGGRVRRITSIKRFRQVGPVRDPAFTNSTVAAFSKETDVTMPAPETPAPEPPVPPTPAPEPEPIKVKASLGNETAEATERFARTLDTSQIENAMDAIVASSNGDLKGIALDQYEAYAKVYGERKKVDGEDTERAARMKALHDIRLGRIPKAPAQSETFASDEYNEAFGQYLRSGNPRVMEQFAQTIAGDGSQGGFTVPDGFIAKLTERLKAFGGIATEAEEITTTTGESLRWAYIDDTGNKAQVVAEDTQATTGAYLLFDGVELGAFEYDATGASGNPIEVSLPLLQDSAFDIEALLLRMLGKRIGRKQADHFATGGGGTEPVGLLTKAADTMTATATSLAVPEHILQVDSEYRNSGNAKWVMSDTSLAKLWTAQATTNEPLFLPGRTINGKPFDTAYGFPIIIDPAAGDLVAFGDIKAGYIIRRVRGVQLLVDPYTAQKRRAVQYHAWARADANIQDPNAYSVSTWSGVSADT